MQFNIGNTHFGFAASGFAITRTATPSMRGFALAVSLAYGGRFQPCVSFMIYRDDAKEKLFKSYTAALRSFDNGKRLLNIGKLPNYL